VDGLPQALEGGALLGGHLGEEGINGGAGAGMRQAPWGKE